ncbi:MAG: hypothetical protein LC122_05180 [Chitinophagales bacterium]|nr:hypothetical protein [Chitinophagales bacterium]
MYVVKADYKGRISTDLLNMLLAEDEGAILEQSSKVAEHTIAAMVGKLYNVANEFAKVGSERNYYLLSLAINIALYQIYNIADDEQVPEKIIKNYDDTIMTAKISRKSKLSLPPFIVENSGTDATDEKAGTTGTGLRRYGSIKKRTHNI